eukprot:3060998-Rhodomonas_salina.1
MSEPAPLEMACGEIASSALDLGVCAPRNTPARSVTRPRQTQLAPPILAHSTLLKRVSTYLPTCMHACVHAHVYVGR